MKFTDTPGLLDSQGTKEDAVNIRNIVQYFKSLGAMNAFLIVLNEQSVRFDSGMQDAIKLIVDSFGSGVLCQDHTPSAPGPSNKHRPVLGKSASLSQPGPGHCVPELPCWQVDCHPEILAAIGVPEDRIHALKQRTSVAVHDILQWARVQPPFQTEQAVAADYDHVRPRGGERRKITRWCPRPWSRRSAKPAVPRSSAKKLIESVPFFVRLGNLGTSNIANQVVVWGPRSTWWKEQRKVETLGNGRKIYHDWRLVKTWEEK